MNFQIKSLKEFKLMGIEIKCGQNQSENNLIISKLWKKFNANLWKIKNRKESVEWCKFGLSCDSNGKEFRYIAAVEVLDHNSIPEGMSIKTVKALDFAVFTHKGELKSIKDTIYQIYKIWLPESKYKIIPSTKCGINHFEKYDKRFLWAKENSEIDIYVLHP